MDGPIRVLHVDDEPDVADLAATYLERQDDRFVVTTADSPDAGLAVLADHGAGAGEGERFDCIVSDYDMPGRDGIAFLEAVRAEYPDVPFVLFTGKGSEEVASEAISAGVTDYLQKGSGTDQYALLANRIRNAVEANRARRASAERKRRLETLIDNIPGVVYRCRNEPGWPMDMVEGDVEDLTGQTATALTDGTVSWGDDLVHPEDRDDVWTQVQAAVAADDPFELTYRLRPDGEHGETTWVWERGRLVQTETGEAVLEGFVTDVTQTHERERELELLQARTRELMSTSSVEETATLAVETADEVLDASLSGVHLLNEDATRLELVTPTDALDEAFDEPPGYDRNADPAEDPVSALVWETYESGEPAVLHDIEADGRLAGETPAGSGLVYPVDDHGVFIVSTREAGAFDSTDVSMVRILASTLTAALDRVQRESALRALHDASSVLTEAEDPETVAEETVRMAGAVLSQPKAGVWLAETVDGRTVLSPAAIGEEGGDLVDEQPTFEPGESLAWKVYERGEPTVYDDVGSDPDRYNPDTEVGSEVVLPLGEHGVLIIGSRETDAFDETDVMLATVLAGQATAELARAAREAELREQRRELERQNERLDSFASIVSHDMRNPLNVAQGHLDLARETCDNEHLDTVADAHDRLSALIDDVLSLSREGSTVTSFEPIDLAAAAERAWGNVQTGTATLSLGPGVEDATLSGDPSKLGRLLENLFRNSVEHGSTGDRPPSDDPDAGGDVTVTVGVTGEGFFVADDGPGIDAEEVASVFEPGYTTAPSGTGFGLAIVEEIADAHGWTVEVGESSDGGARFEVAGVDRVE